MISYLNEGINLMGYKVYVLTDERMNKWLIYKV